MATTTNYGWTTPNDTDLVKDGAAAIRTLGSSIDTTVFANESAGIPKTIVDAKGDIIAATAADTVSRLAVGANNTVLTADSSTATGLKWAAAAAGGKVLQVIQGTTNTDTSNNTTTYADTTLTASITPSSATSKVLVLVSQNGVGKKVGDVNSACSIKLLRDATTLQSALGIGYTNSSLQLTIGSMALNYLDSPATTSATTYKTQFRNDTNAVGARVQTGNAESQIILLEIGA